MNGNIKVSGRREKTLSATEQPIEINKKVSAMSKLMTSKQAAEYLCISERKLWDLQKSQRIPVVRIDRSVRFDRDDLDAFIMDAKK